MINMNVAQEFFEGFRMIENDSKESPDFELALKHYDFISRSGEFIFYIGEGHTSIEQFRKLGFSEDFAAACIEAQAFGFDYICLYL